LTNFHKIDILQSQIHRVAVQMFLRVSGEKPEEADSTEISKGKMVCVPIYFCLKFF
jgi:hypothetical protein